MNSSRWIFVWLHETSMISKCHSISMTVHRSTFINLFSDRQAHKRIRTTLVHTGTLTNLTSRSNQQHLSTADIAPSMQGIMKGVPVDWLWSLNECIFDRRIISNWKELIRNQTMSLKSRYKRTETGLRFKLHANQGSRSAQEKDSGLFDVFHLTMWYSSSSSSSSGWSLAA